MLTAFIQEWHDDRDTACLTTNGCDDTFYISVVVVRRHVVCLSAQRVSHAVVGYIHHDIEVITTNGIFNHTFGFTGTKTRGICIYNIRCAVIILECNVILVCIVTCVPPFYKILVDLFSKFRAAC